MQEKETISNGPFRLNSWLNQIGVTPCTGWRWRKKGWIKTLNIAGKLYVTSEAIAEFNQRAAKGEFSKEPVTPGNTTKDCF